MLDQLHCLTQACNELHLSYSFFDDNHNCIRVRVKDAELFFVNCATSFNIESHARIAEDKYFTYKLCHTSLSMPTTHIYIDPLVPPQHREYADYLSYEAIVSHIVQTNPLPVIVKRNRGSYGNNVFLCKREEEVATAIQAVFNKQSQHYDYAALAQEYLRIAREFRVITFQQKVLLLYEKDTTGAQFVGNLSPLHWKNAKAVHIKDEILVRQVERFLQPFFTKLPLTFVGFDVARLEDGTLSLIEANTRPGLDYFIKDNGSTPVVELYRKMLQLT